jgi:hypothetical protein
MFYLYNFGVCLDISRNWEEICSQYSRLRGEKRIIQDVDGKGSLFIVAEKLW